MSSASILKPVNILHLSVREYRTIYQRSKLLNITPKVYPDVKAPPGVKYNIFNRNPRNLERLRIEYKNEGWVLEKTKHTYWHRLVVKETSKGIVASVLHKDGDTVLSAGSDEWCIRKFLYNPTDKSAYVNVGRIFARRCLESGLTEMANLYEPIPGGKLELLIKEVQAGGVSLSEPPRLIYEDTFTKVKPERPWDVHE
ncbi:large ribosomal subunit protein uL18m-like isoform X2 [Planococcus citri]|uniref:large ribosomal subunit protein uL18m-like isoform X2 n=1 Tax=Planococcus citri TaxID=170843 RepID=UPI0031F8548B